MAEEKTIITLMCERAADVNGILDAKGQCTTVDGVKVVKLPCSGMIQPLMIDNALKAGASGVIVCGCQIGDCYYREGNRMIRERLLGERAPGLKKTVDRRRIMALWLSRLQRGKFESEAKEFVAYIKDLDSKEPAKVAAAPAAKPADKPAEKKEEKKADAPTAVTEEKKEEKAEEKKETPKAEDKGAEEKKAE